MRDNEQLHHEIVELRKQRGAHLMDESDYTQAILDIIAHRERDAVRAALERVKNSSDIPYSHRNVLNAVIDAELAQLTQAESQLTPEEGK